MTKPDNIKIETNHQLTLPGPSFEQILAEHNYQLEHSTPSELQINLGKLCNLACHHCHVDAGPKRTEIMTWQTMLKILDWVKQSKVKHVDLTGGAPELNPHFRKFCDRLIELDIALTSRCNLTVLFEPGQDDLAEWYAQRKVRLVCSLPCYSEKNVNEQRGKGVFDKSIKALQALNQVGYGDNNSELTLDLVYNPNGAFLPPNQATLEQDYRDMLSENFSIQFNNLLTITNLPINRFAHSLKRDGELDTYQELLVENFNADTLDGLMCRHQINLDWEGRIYDCDFNQMLDIPFADAGNKYLWEIDAKQVQGQTIAVDKHCFGCTAGAGSSCGGALTA